jgi:hypothetical protein
MEMNDLRVIRIDEVWYVPTTDVQSYGIVSDRAVVTLKSGKSWVNMYFTPGTAALEESHADEGRAWAYLQRFSASMPGEDIENTEWVDEYNNRPVLIKLVQNNGVKLLGSLDIPCRMRLTYSTTESGILLRVERKSKERARWFS